MTSTFRVQADFFKSKRVSAFNSCTPQPHSYPTKPNIDASKFREVNVLLDELVRTRAQHDVHANEAVKLLRNELMGIMRVTSLNGPISTEFLADLDDQNVSMLIDAAITPPAHFIWIGYRIREESQKGLPMSPELLAEKNLSERISELRHAHPGFEMAVKFLVDSYGAVALYKALEASGRVSFRDKRFGADLGL